MTGNEFDDNGVAEAAASCCERRKERGILNPSICPPKSTVVESGSGSDMIKGLCTISEEIGSMRSCGRDSVLSSELLGVCPEETEKIN